MSRDKRLVVGGLIAYNEGNVENCYVKTEIKGVKKADLIGEQKGCEENTAYEFSIRDNTIRGKKGEYEAELEVDKIQLDESEFIRIDSVETYLKVVEKINDEKTKDNLKTYIITSNLDFNKKEIPMIGTEKHPFMGKLICIEDGLQIMNFVIDSNDTSIGLIKYAKNAYFYGINLLNGYIEGENTVGSLLGTAENCTVENCVVNATFIIGRENVGGLIGKNLGYIEDNLKSIYNCKLNYCTIKIKRRAAIIWWLLGLLLLAGLTVGITITLLITGGKPDKDPGAQMYPGIGIEQNQKPIPGDTNIGQGGRSVVFEFTKAITADSGNGVAKLEFKCPARSSSDIAIELQITDAELKSKLGKTGRTEEEQAKLEAQENYTEDGSRVIIGTTKVVQRGNQLENIQLLPLADGTYLPNGKYNAVVYLKMYNPDNGQQESLKSQLPVLLIIGEQ